ncbi:SRPBCC domain-containing protein [Paenibacillus filicis]|uniref:SRPBCC domain-containing protein n=1 Tax=Paenibacillus gyeongsangnamensis TaxID=3388067 RepID=A0ABT4Q2D1_9BACL|nr:SRPBCC domain-containing protein [Paenibacillus filicis]MCZ8511031.1 SRPBCC domain-containing protein [Paenibacillus filicis]
MASRITKEALQTETGRALEDWRTVLQQEAGAAWSDEEIVHYLSETYEIDDPWNRLIASDYAGQLGRKPVGQTADAGFQIGVRRTLPLSPEQLWPMLVSKQGLSLWIGEQPVFRLEPGQRFSSKQGAFGELRVVKPSQQLRMTWQLPDWEVPSMLQIRLLPGSQGKTTLSFHQEKLAGAFAREEMRLHWEDVIQHMLEFAAGREGGEAR